MKETIISWTTRTWNPVHGCSKVSPGCDRCYAERISLGAGFTKKAWIGRNAEENVQLKPHKLREPYKLKDPSMIFVNSMSDLFHPLIPNDYREQIFGVMADCHQHTFQVLTKRPKAATLWKGGWPDNVWMGVSVEDRARLHRLDELRPCKASVLFVSFEPLLDDVATDEAFDLSGFGWVIVGGESGKGYRPMPHEWARKIRDYCVEQKIAYFFKQSAAYRTEVGTALEEHDGSRAVWNQYPGDLTEPRVIVPPA